MTLWWCCLPVSCLLVGNYLNSWRNNLGRVSLQKIPKKDYWYKLKTDYWYYWSTAGMDSLHHIQNRILWMHDPKRFFTTDAKRVNTVGGSSPTAIRTDACYKNPLLFIAADAGVCKFLFGWAVMNNLLACILACISERQTWWRHQGNVFYWHKLWKIKITPIM